METLNKKTQIHVKALESANNADVLKSIQALRLNGTEEAIPFLVQTLVNNPDEDIKNEITHLLFDLKNIKALPALVMEIINPANLEFQHILISACWESGMDCSKYLNFFVELAINSNYCVAFECLTVIENMVGPFNVPKMDELIEKTKNAADEDPSRFDLLNSLWEVLVDIKASGEPE
ncbi:MAG: HEAT repeat domain-containing protein [Bacteroidetes bacterium]|nr:HEAT repeat domain-containing protein [Bacteroidota bacterium]HET6244090.1 HEAT repeat domain-containing protein [Bacteroidia bacterium]